MDETQVAEQLAVAVAHLVDDLAECLYWLAKKYTSHSEEAEELNKSLDYVFGTHMRLVREDE